jgi:SAM-dependent methyltransferase
MLLTPPRSDRTEMMDRPGLARRDLDRALRDIGRVNRFLGGRRALLGALRPLLRRGSGALELLDVGTGGADLPLAMVRCARRMGRQLRVTALDRDPVIASIAARQTADSSQIRVVAADAFHPPFAPGSFDFVTASMFLHHFEHDDAVRLLASFRRLARRAVVINDLRRHRLPWSAIHAIAWITRRHPIFVHDAPLSVLRGFTARELRRAARLAGGRTARVARRWPYRLVLTLDAEVAAE